MERKVKVQKFNEQKKLISKEVEERLLSLYLNQGWELSNTFSIKKEIKIETNKNNNPINKHE